jgi:hypothetical protein
MTTYYIRPMGDGTFRVRHGSELVTVFGDWSVMDESIRVASAAGISWEWEDA